MVTPSDYDALADLFLAGQPCVGGDQCVIPRGLVHDDSSCAAAISGCCDTAGR